LCIKQNDLEYLPNTLCNLENLEELVCNHNMLKFLPDGLENLTNLKVLQCHHNDIELLPYDITRLKLKELTYDKDKIMSNTVNMMKYLIDNSDKCKEFYKKRRFDEI
jgi:Leucine-rich repeat (LRR) protein